MTDVLQLLPVPPPMRRITATRKANAAMWANPAFKQKMADLNRKRWADPEYRARQSALRKSEYQAKADKMHTARKSASSRAKTSSEMKRRWSDPAYRERSIASMRAKFSDPSFAQAHMERLRKSVHGRPEIYAKISAKLKANPPRTAFNTARSKRALRIRAAKKRPA